MLLQVRFLHLSTKFPVKDTKQKLLKTPKFERREIKREISEITKFDCNCEKISVMGRASEQRERERGTTTGGVG